MKKKIEITYNYISIMYLSFKIKILNFNIFIVRKDYQN